MANHFRTSQIICFLAVSLAIFLMPIVDGRADQGDPLLILSNKVNESAEHYIGIPYKWGGNPDKEPFADCSHLVTAVLKRSLRSSGIELHPTEMNTTLIKAKTHTISRKDARPGDIVFFQMSKKETGYNVGIITNINNAVEFTHVSTTRGVISTSTNFDSWNYYWKDRLHSFRRWNTDIFKTTLNKTP